MSQVPHLFRQHWANPNQVGAARPGGQAYIRTGKFERRYSHWEHPEKMHIPHSSEGRPWQATWTPNSDYYDLPNLQSVKLQQDFEQKGVCVATITIDNIIYKQQEGPLGAIYHAIERGYLAPFRGFVQLGRPATAHLRHDPWYGKKLAKNEWFQRLNRNSQITVVESYGDERVCTFTGLIDDIDMDSNPTQIVITARDFGQAGDQHVFGHVIDPHLRDPVTFVDLKSNEEVKYVGGHAKASSHRAGHPPRFVLDENPHTAWISHDRDAPDRTEWCEIKLPHGHYQGIYIAPRYVGLEVYVGINGKARNGHDTYIVDGQGHDPGWFDPHGTVVPGDTNGGWPYFRLLKKVHPHGVHVPLKHEFSVGDGTILRIGIRNLHHARPGKYHGGLKRLHAKRLRIKPVARKFVLVHDAADIVKLAYRWMGFKEWKIESTGVRVKGHYVVNRAKTLTDMVQDAADQTGYVAFIQPPVIEFDVDGRPAPDHSIGVPIFRRNGALDRREGAVDLRDRNLLTGVQVKINEDPLASDIRVRGKLTTRARGGTRLGGDTSFRLTGHYRPPWAKRLAGIEKYEVINRFELKSKSEVLFACFLIALQQALAAVTAIVEIPGTPEFDLDEHISLVDVGTGINTRMWVAQRSSEHTFGEDGKWVTTLGGALIDTPDIIAIKRDIRRFFRHLTEADPDGDRNVIFDEQRHPRPGHHRRDWWHGVGEEPEREDDD